MSKQQRIKKLIEQLATECGYDKSEAGGEAFLTELHAATKFVVEGAIVAAHNEGRKFSCIHSLTIQLADKNDTLPAEVVSDTKNNPR